MARPRSISSMKPTNHSATPDTSLTNITTAPFGHPSEPRTHYYTDKYVY